MQVFKLGVGDRLLTHQSVVTATRAFGITNLTRVIMSIARIRCLVDSHKSFDSGKSFSFFPASQKLKICPLWWVPQQKALTWSVDDGQVGAELVLDLDHNLSLPELLLALQTGVLVLNVLLRPVSCLKVRLPPCLG